jgi:ATP-binding protein involved in chromosome partitioning
MMLFNRIGRFFMSTHAEITQILQSFIDPYLKQDLISAKAVQNIAINNDSIVINILLGYPARGYQTQLINELATRLQSLRNIRDIKININWQIISHAVQTGLKTLPGVKNIIAVASGKGGVGKSTTAVNLALALAVEGAQVGILDADIYGPNQPQMLGSQQVPVSNNSHSLEPVLAHGLQTMSIGYLIDPNTPMVWRGPMVTGALQQLLNDTQWRNLDYLIIDLPPGTGDIQLTLAQKIPVSGAVMVTTPQDIALLDVRKGIAMFRKVNVPILGVVENMSLHTCSQCGHVEPIFGTGGGERLAEQFDIDLLGKLPLDMRIREQADSGKPTVITEPDSPIALIYRDIARKVAAKLALKAKDYSAKFPNIVIKNE